MTMDAMVRRLESRGFKADKKYDPSTKSYRFAIERGGSYLVRYFKWLNCDEPWLHQERFLKDMVEEFERAEKEMMTVDDMRLYLVAQGIATATYDHKNDSGEHEVIFIVMRRGRSLRRILNEYNIGGLTEIQRHRRDFLKEIVDAFEYEERKEEELKFKTIDLDIRKLYPETMYVSDIINKIIHEKEKEEMKGIQWKVTNITVDNRRNVEPDVTAEVKAFFTIPTYVDPIKLTEDLEARFNADTHISPSTKLPAIEKVIFNDPATIIIWKDGTKTVVKAHNEAYDPEKGFAMAITKKALGNEGNYFETVKKWVGDYCLSKAMIHIGAKITDGWKEAIKRFEDFGKSVSKKVEEKTEQSAKWLATQRLYNALGDKKATKADLKFAMEEAIKYLEGDK